MMINNAPCATCRNIQSAHDGDGNVLAARIGEKDTIVRGGDRFFVCPACERLFAVKEVRDGSSIRYAIVSAASVNRRYQWMVDSADGGRQRAKGSMTEEEARRKHSNPVKIVHQPIHQTSQ